MNRYRAYDLTIRSEFDLPELAATAERPAEVSFRSGELEPVTRANGQDDSFRVDATANTARLTYDPVGSFLVEDGRSVTFDPATDEAMENITTRRLLTNQMMGLILHQRGQLVLHASAVTVDGNAIVFLGQRGAGKSTLAAAFHQLGHEVLEDDTVGIRFESEEPTVVPGVPQLRIRPQTAEELGIESPTRMPSAADQEKIRLDPDATPDPAPLAGCFLLQRGGPTDVQKLSLSDRFFSLLSQTIACSVLADTDATGSHFEQCTELIESTTVRKLRYPDDLAKLPSVARWLTNEIRDNGC